MNIVRAYAHRRHRHRHRHRHWQLAIFRTHRQAALSLPEMMLAISLCMPLVLGTIKLLCQTLSEQSLSYQTLLMEQDAQFALEIIRNLIQQAGHHDPLTAASASARPRLHGMDDATLGSRTDIHVGKSGPGPAGSDVLIIHFYGSDSSGSSPLNCAGMPVPAAKAGSSDQTADEQGYSVIYLARGPNGENELRCKYRTLTGWDSEALLQGIESFQVLYGLDRDGDGLPEHYLRASALTAEISSGVSEAGLWNQVVAVKIALLMRSAQRVQQATVPTSWNLFGADYTAQHAAQDRGTRLSSEDFTGELRHRLRRSYEQLIFLRNPSHSVVNE